MLVRRRSYALAVAAFLAVAGGIAAAIVLATGGAHGATLTRAEYLARVEAICDRHGKRLDRIAPPTDLSSPGSVFESISLALPVLREQAEEARKLRPPRELQPQLRRFFALTDRSLDRLAAARNAAGRRELFPMARALTEFSIWRNAAKRLARQIGFHC